VLLIGPEVRLAVCYRTESFITLRRYVQMEPTYIYRIERHKSIILIYIAPGMKRCREMADVGCIRRSSGVRGFVLHVSNRNPSNARLKARASYDLHKFTSV
jgi:hypothetical protein